ncbi:hypothetical protein MAR_035725 [Mya arenaria]|uniref:Transposase n=1 Tax=Mya arenaria TaxID=6604 RepID=A0ABY7ENJ5_MYAAR|nr:hypothetical protein MAR_035725 [Mya arenaria]
MSNSCWTVRKWSCYRQSVRTNNDCEGWHRRINGKAGRSNLQYNAETVRRQIQLVFEHILSRHNRTVYRELDGRMQDLWTSFDDGKISASAFLKSIWAMYRPI